MIRSHLGDQAWLAATVSDSVFIARCSPLELAGADVLRSGSCGRHFEGRPAQRPASWPSGPPRRRTSRNEGAMARTLW